MRHLEEYITVGDKHMRCGYTTGTCAAGAARAAAELLLTGAAPAAICVSTPAGIRVTLDIEDCWRDGSRASCSVMKDGGDDPDVTTGAMVVVEVTLQQEPGILIAAGEGVGKVTRPGLDQPVGEAAINSVPRSMIKEQLEESAAGAGYLGGFRVVVSVPGGAELAAKTFNPKLGIEGGISILGTSGIVRPMSEDALVASLELEMRQHYAEGDRLLLVAPGNYGRDYANDALELDVSRCLQCSNYIGKALDAAVATGYQHILVVGHIGKMVKVAAGIMNTHSRVADGRCETLAAHAALQGASQELVAAIMTSATTDAALDSLAEAGLIEPTMGSMMKSLERHLNGRVGDNAAIECIVFSKVHGLLGQTSGASKLIDQLKAAQMQQLLSEEGEL